MAISRLGRGLTEPGEAGACRGPAGNRAASASRRELWTMASCLAISRETGSISCAPSGLIVSAPCVVVNGVAGSLSGAPPGRTTAPCRYLRDCCLYSTLAGLDGSPQRKSRAETVTRLTSNSVEQLSLKSDIVSHKSDPRRHFISVAIAHVGNRKKPKKGKQIQYRTISELFSGKQG